MSLINDALKKTQRTRSGPSPPPPPPFRQPPPPTSSERRADMLKLFCALIIIAGIMGGGVAYVVMKFSGGTEVALQTEDGSTAPPAAPVPSESHPPPIARADPRTQPSPSPAPPTAPPVPLPSPPHLPSKPVVPVGLASVPEPSLPSRQGAPPEVQRSADAATQPPRPQPRPKTVIGVTRQVVAKGNANMARVDNVLASEVPTVENAPPTTVEPNGSATPSYPSAAPAVVKVRATPKPPSFPPVVQSREPVSVSAPAAKRSSSSASKTEYLPRSNPVNQKPRIQPGKVAYTVPKSLPSSGSLTLDDPNKRVVSASQNLAAQNKIVLKFLDEINVRGVKLAGENSKVLMNNKVFRVHNTVNNEFMLKIMEIKQHEIVFVDHAGVTYTKFF